MKKETKSNKLIIIIGIIISCVLFIVCMLYIFKSYFNIHCLDFLNNIETRESNTLIPIIALLASVLTFIAFYIQKMANDQIRDQFKVQQFETQFYQMIRLHKENVNEIEYNSRNELIFKGRNFFFQMYKGLNEMLDNINKNYNNRNDMYNQYFYIQYHIMYFEIMKNKIELDIKPTVIDFDWNKIAINDVNCDFLNIYYRHLFNTVKFVANSNIIEEKEKLNYLKILRSQLSNYEQIMLFYNWLSGLGKDWENEENHFFTK